MDNKPQVALTPVAMGPQTLDEAQLSQAMKRLKLLHMKVCMIVGDPRPPANA